MQNRRRNSYLESSYTGVGAFSSSPAPHTNALAAASVIGNALKANNHNPVGLNLPKLQPPKASRTESISSRNSSIVAGNSYARVNSIRNNSVNTATARRLSLSSIQKQRLSAQKSVPNLKSRRSVSDFTDSNINRSSVYTTNKNIPKTIKKYVPSANGLVAVEVPNPKHPDNIKIQNQQSQQRTTSFRRSVSISNLPKGTFHSNIKSDKTNSINYQTDKNPNLSLKNNYLHRNNNDSKSITKNIKRETKLLPDGTKVIKTTIEEYSRDDDYDDAYDDAYDDSYDDFDDVHRQVDMSITLDDDLIEANDENIDTSVIIPEHDINYSNQKELDGIIEDEGEEQEEEEVIIYSDHENIETSKSIEVKQGDKVLEKSDTLTNSFKNEDANDVQNLKHDDEKEIIDELVSEIKYEDNIKDVIAQNEELERVEREKAFESVDEPVNDPVIVEDIMSRHLVQNIKHLGLPSEIKHGGILSAGLLQNQDSNMISDNNIYKNDETDCGIDDEEQYERQAEEQDDEQNDEQYEGDYVDDLNDDSIGDFSPHKTITMKTSEQYSEAELLAAQKKLDELVKQKEQEILRDYIADGQLENIAALDHVDNDTRDNESTTSQYSDDAELDAQHDPSQEIPNSEKESKDLTKTFTTQTKASESDAELIFHTTSANANLSKEVQNAYIDSIPLADEKEIDDDKFYTPPITPVIPLSDAATIERSQSPSETLQQSFSGKSIQTSPKRSESPDSSMIRTTQSSDPTTPLEGAQTKSMAQHLRPMVNLRSKQIHSSSINQTRNGNNIAILNVPDDFDTYSGDDIDALEVPKREPSVQAKIDIAANQVRPGVDMENSNEVIENHQIDNNRASIPNNNSSASVNKRKSVLKKSSSTNNRQSMYASNNQSNGASDAYLSLATAQNTKLNAMASTSASLQQKNGGRQGVNTLQDPNLASRSRSRSGSASSNNNAYSNNAADFTPLAAATKAAQRHSIQPNSMVYASGNGFEQVERKSKRNSTATTAKENAINSSVNVGGFKAPNPKVEEAKKRILQNRPGQKRAKELYELAKTRAPVKSDDLVALDDSTWGRRSSFEKVHDVPQESDSSTNRKNKMTSLSLRDISTLNYDEYEKKKAIHRGFKSRFADDNSDTDLPLPAQIEKSIPASTLQYHPSNDFSTSVNLPPQSTNATTNERTKSGFKFKFGGLGKKQSKQALTGSTQITSPADVSSSQPNVISHINIGHKKPASESNSEPRSESKFEKFFSEPHGPAGKRAVSTSSAITTGTTATNEEGKKKGSRLKRLFGDRK